MYFEKEYSVKITSYGGYKVNARKDINKNYLTQSGIGICGLCKLEALLAIQFKEDLWLDKYGYALPDDQVMYYKMYLKGYKLVASPKNTFIHLDAKTGHVADVDLIKKFKKTTKLTSRNFTIFWYKYVWSYRNGLSKLWAGIALGIKMIITCLDTLLKCIAFRRWSCILASVEGYHQAFKEIRNKTV